MLLLYNKGYNYRQTITLPLNYNTNKNSTHAPHPSASEPIN
jgi:hypothetical protein